MEDTRLVPEEFGHRTESRVAHGATKAEPAQSSHAAFGVSWELRSDSAALHHVLLERLPPGATSRAGGNVERAYTLRTLPATIAERDASYLLLADGRPLLRSSEPMEIADAFVLNKCDLSGADATQAQIVGAIGEERPLWRISAVRDEGIDAVANWAASL